MRHTSMDTSKASSGLGAKAAQRHAILGAAPRGSLAAASRGGRYLLLRVASFLVLCCWSGHGLAADIATAEALFKEGRRLLDEGKLAEACEKFAASQRIDASPGTQLNLARCHEMQGRTATAWAEYLAAKRAATVAGRTRIAEVAAQRAAALEPSLSYLTVEVEAPVAGLRVTRSGVPLEAASYGTKLPVDPGTQRVAATAPGHEPWSGDIVVAERESRSLRVPPLTKQVETSPGGTTAAPRVAPPSPGPRDEPIPLPPEPPSSASSAPLAAYLTAGFGVAALGAGLVFGLAAKHEYDQASSECPSRVDCDDNAMDRRGRADAYATVANVAVPIGLVAIGAGAYLYFTDTEGPRQASTLALSVGVAPGARGLVEGRVRW